MNTIPLQDIYDGIIHIPQYIHDILNSMTGEEDYPELEEKRKELLMYGRDLDYDLDAVVINLIQYEQEEQQQLTPTVHESFIHFVHCKNKLRNIRTWNNAEATARALNDLRAAANECRSYARGHK